jgi:hypothetical protein
MNKMLRYAAETFDALDVAGDDVNSEICFSNRVSQHSQHVDQWIGGRSWLADASHHVSETSPGQPGHYEHDCTFLGPLESLSIGQQTLHPTDLKKHIKDEITAIEKSKLRTAMITFWSR